jgi:uncharacterized protein YjiS (DUF1127 family)
MTGGLQSGHARRAPGQPVERVLATLREWRRRIRVRKELATFGDRMLEDIGITRAEAECVSCKPFWS